MSAARFLLGFVTVALLFTALFVFGFALAAGGVAGSVALSLVVAAALGGGLWWLQRRVYVESAGVIRYVPEDWERRRGDVTIECDEPQIIVYTGLVAGAGTPRAGDRVRLLVPIHAPFRATVVAEPQPWPLTGATLLIGPWVRITLGRWGRLFGRPVWRTTNVERLVDQPSELFGELVLDWHRARCTPLAEALHNTPEFLALDAMFEDSWQRVMSRALRDQRIVFAATAAQRSRTFRALLPLPFYALCLGLVAVALHDTALILWAALESLVEGSVQPFLATVHWTAAVAATGLPRLDFYAVLAALVVLLIALFRGGAHAGRRARLAYRTWRSDLAVVVEDRLRAVYQGLANAQSPATLSLRSAPGFAVLSADQIVPRTEAGRLRGLAFDLGAGAVAISGSRGVGKTTLLNALVHDHESGALGTVVSAPVRYEPRDFLLHLYAQLCRTVLARLGEQRGSGRLRRALAQLRRLLAWLVRTLATLCLAAVLFPGTRDWLAAELPLPRLPATYLVAGVALYVLARWIRGPQPARELALAAEAARRLRQTRFLQTFAREGSAGLGHGPMQAGLRRSRQWAEQPHSLPELVDSYRTFATEVAEWWRAENDGRGKLLIAIDEVDRIADPQQAEQFVNEIKAAFGVRHCVFLVSLSDEALANFERRLVRVRTVFDSAFDHVVRLRALTLVESVHLLRNRVTGVPDVFWMLCHCLAGGMPRDVLRMARTMLDEHRESTGPTLLPVMARRLVAFEAQAVKRAFVMQAGAETDPVVAELLADAAWPGLRSDDLLRAAESAPAGSMSAIFLYYATILEIFTSAPHILLGWRKLLHPGPRPRSPEPTARLVADLVEAHRLMAIDAAVAIKQIRRIRDDIQAHTPALNVSHFSGSPES